MNFESIMVTILGGVGLFYGSNVNITRMVVSLIAIMGFDLFTGVFKAVKYKNLQSSKWIDGFIRKVCMLLCISFCYYLDKTQAIDLGVNLESASTLYFLGGEVISVLENFVSLGIILPPVLTNLLKKEQITQIETVSIVTNSVNPNDQSIPINVNSEIEVSKGCQSK
jgi:toxin secretion/phage lysis holin